MTAASLSTGAQSVDGVLGSKQQLIALREATLHWLRHDAGRTLLFAGFSFGIGWAVNVLIMALRYDGYNTPFGGAATGRGNTVVGTVFWFLLSAIVSGLICYCIRVGPERFAVEVRAFPQTLRTAFKEDGDSAIVHLLWGFAGSMLVVVVFLLGPASSGLFAATLLILLAGILRPITVWLLMTAWSTIARRLFGKRSVPPPLALCVAILGGAAASFAALLVTSPGARVALLLAAAGAAFVISRRRVPAAPTAALFLAVGSAAAWLLSPETVSADDGGWRECGAQLERWLQCGGSDRVFMHGLLGGGASAAGGPFGAGLGDGSARMTEERRQWLAWREQHPNSPPSDYWAWRESQQGPLPAWMRDTLQFGGDFLTSYKDTLVSGEQAEWLKEGPSAAWEGFSGAAVDTWDMLKSSPEFMKDFANAYMDDVSSGAQLERLKGMFSKADEMIGVARDFYSRSPEEIQAAYAQFGKENVDQFMATMGQLDRALTNADSKDVARAIFKLAGSAEFEALSGAALEKGFGMLGAKGTGMLDEGADLTRGGQRGDDLLPVERPGGPRKGSRSGPPPVTPGTDLTRGSLNDLMLHYGEYIPESRQLYAEATLPKRTQYLDRTDFNREYVNMGGRQPPDLVDGAYDIQNGKILLDKDSPYLKHNTNHEVNHALQNPEFQQRVGKNFMEGANELYSRRTTTAAGYATSDAYQSQVGLARTVEKLVGEQTLARANFGSGDAPIDALRDALDSKVGPGTFDQMIKYAETQGADYANGWLVIQAKL